MLALLGKWNNCPFFLWYKHAKSTTITTTAEKIPARLQQQQLIRLSFASIREARTGMLRLLHQPLRRTSLSRYDSWTSIISSSPSRPFADLWLRAAKKKRPFICYVSVSLFLYKSNGSKVSLLLTFFLSRWNKRRYSLKTFSDGLHLSHYLTVSKICSKHLNIICYLSVSLYIH